MKLREEKAQTNRGSCWECGYNWKTGEKKIRVVFEDMESRSWPYANRNPTLCESCGEKLKPFFSNNVPLVCLNEYSGVVGE